MAFFDIFKDKNQAASSGPDFSNVDQAMAMEMFKNGTLEKLYMMPLEFNGEDIPPNTLYVPLGIAAIKARIDQNIIGPLIAEGKVSNYNVTPEYQGSSFIPIAISITASNPGQFNTTINIWGEALGRK